MSDSGFSGSEEEAPKLVQVAKNSIFVRNLSPQVSETILRDIFDKHDHIHKVTFRAFPNSNNQFFAQLDFATSAGVTEGTRLSGLSILGVPCEIGVIDPVLNAQKVRAAAAAGESEGPAPIDEAATLEELNKRIAEAHEDQRMRTVRVTGLADDCTSEQFERFCKKFGEVERLKVEKDTEGCTFGLVEFKERPPAHIIKMQQQYMVDGRILRCSESKSMVDESAFTEQIVQFQAPILDAMNMRQVLSQQFELSGKLAQVRAAALELTKKKGQGDSAGDEAAGSKDQEGKEKKDKKRKKEKKKDSKLKKKEKKKKNKKKKQKKRQQKEKAKRKRKQLESGAGGKKRKRKAMEEEEEDDDDEPEDEEESLAASESGSGLVDLDSEVEVVDNTELLVLGTSSASSVSSASSSDACNMSLVVPLEPMRKRGRRLAAARAKAAAAATPVPEFVPVAPVAPVLPLPAPPAMPLSLAALVGKWIVGGDPTGVWVVEEGGCALFNGKAVSAKWSFAEDSGEAGSQIFSRGQRKNGWELDMKASTVDRLVWKKAGEADTLWDRLPAEAAAPPHEPDAVVGR